MALKCTPTQLEFHAFGRRDVAGSFDGGRITSDGGGLLLRELDRRIGLLTRLGTCFTDHRNPNSIEHSGQSLVAQRIYDLDYEDLNDHDVLRARFWPCLWISGLIDEYRRRAQYRGNPLTGSSTGNRLELATPELAATKRYKRLQQLRSRWTTMCISNRMR